MTEQELQAVKQAVQDVSQSVQDMKQSLQSAGQLSKDQSGGKATLGIEDISHDIGSDEAFSGKTYVDAELWGFDKKQIAASEQTERVRSLELDNQIKQVELARKQHDFNHKQKLDSIEIANAQDAAIFRHAINMEYAKFNSAVSEPISPNTQTTGNATSPLRRS